MRNALDELAKTDREAALEVLAVIARGLHDCSYYCYGR